MLKMHSSLTLSAVLLSATVISSPSQASILPPTPSEHRASFAPTQDTGNRWFHRLSGEQRDLSATISLAQIDARGGSPLKLPQLASVCFITDAGNCNGNEFESSPDNSSSGGTPGESSSSGGDACAPNDAWCLDNQKRCEKEGYPQTSCNSVQYPVNFCPYDNSYFEKCVCKPNLQTCTKPYYGVGESCGGKYKSCQLDNARACKEDGYTQTGSCNSVQTINKKCPYDPTYFDKCVCRGDLQKCASPLQGVGTACGGKYASCQCPSNYQSCNCGAAAGASACTWNGVTKYSSCRSCCTPKQGVSPSICYFGYYSCDDGCGGKTTCCNYGKISETITCSPYSIGYGENGHLISGSGCANRYGCCCAGLYSSYSVQYSDGSISSSSGEIAGRCVYYPCDSYNPCSGYPKNYNYI